MPEVRPIDANALMENVCENCPRYNCTPDATDTVYGCMFADSIEAMPTIEPEVRHGRWIETTVRGNQSIICSACSAENQTICPSNFCPNCGARMDGQHSNQLDSNDSKEAEDVGNHGET